MRLLPIAALLLATTAMPADAQEARALDARVTKVERELRAVQRKVFPGGNAQFFEPEIAPPQPAAPPGGVPATSAVADLTARVDSLERQLSQMTGQVEQNGFQLRQLQEQLAKLKGDTDFRLNALEGTAPASGGAPAAVGGALDAEPVRPAPATRAGRTPALAPNPPADAPADAPAAKVPAATPSSGDPGEDAYMAGYRLWEAKKYGEAEAALKAVVAKYPDHRRASYAQNLLGRAYLDEGKPALAAEAFYANYRKMPRGERAPDSLYYLGQALTQLKKPADACKVYDELQDVYGAKIAEPLKSRIAKGRADAKCAS